MIDIATGLLAWYRANARRLPWRDHPDPYAIWVSEVMLQQTQVTTVIPYFERWMQHFPTIKDLAEADEQNVLAVWEGLGYYSRARNLHRAAKLIQESYDGKLPTDPISLRSLPGVGDYTSAAIASIAFGTDSVAMDGNIRRVFSRLYNIATPMDSASGKSMLLHAAEENLPSGGAGDYNQALMDLGATVCLSRKPLCDKCPLADLCKARALGVQDSLPVTKPKRTRPTHVRVAAVIIRDGHYLMHHRQARGLLGGLWEFPDARIDSDPATELVPALKASHGFEALPERELGVVHHGYTHFKVVEHVFICSMGEVPSSLSWIPRADLSHYPMGKIARQIARMLE